MQSPRPPAKFGEAFLAWFRDRTEAAWAKREPANFSGDGPGGLDWQRGTKWTNGLTETEIARAEKAIGFAFPPDYRLFLRTLHVPDRPMAGHLYKRRKKAPATEQPFADWRRVGDVKRRLRDRLRGVLFDVENNELWVKSWGPRPRKKAARARAVQAAMEKGVPLAPIFFHRCLPCAPCREGNPVLSIWQSDIIFYGADLRSWMLVEFAPLLGLNPDREWAAFCRRLRYRFKDYPFWGDVAAQHWQDAAKREAESKKAIAEYKAKVASGE
ncbi:MAG: SMI1/KNR4 family protein, partial [Planctomycetes bacterium]|nr:SMI1/KNR4 family protein [Planctomycetota bacterium]